MWLCVVSHFQSLRELKELGFLDGGGKGGSTNDVTPFVMAGSVSGDSEADVEGSPDEEAVTEEVNSVTSKDGDGDEDSDDDSDDDSDESGMALAIEISSRDQAKQHLPLLVQLLFLKQKRLSAKRTSEFLKKLNTIKGKVKKNIALVVIPHSDDDDDDDDEDNKNDVENPKDPDSDKEGDSGENSGGSNELKY